MLIRISPKTVLAPALTIAILAAPAIASAQYYGPQQPTEMGPGYGASPAPRPAPRRLRQGRSVAVDKSITVENQRGVPLAELSVVPTEIDGALPQVIARDVGSGETTAALVHGGGGCTYEVNGIFADESTVVPSTVDLCATNTIRLYR